MSMAEIRMGIYRHYKGPLYQVIGLAHDANAEDLCAGLEYGHKEPIGERTVVVYMPLQLDGAHLGPRMAVRTLEDFQAILHTDDGSTCPEGHCTKFAGGNFVNRFTYVGPIFIPEDMLL
jgi:hypothetical protein